MLYVFRIISPLLITLLLTACSNKGFGIKPYNSNGENKFIVFIGIGALLEKGYKYNEDSIPYAKDIISKNLAHEKVCQKGFVIVEQLRDARGGDKAYVIKCDEL